MKSITRLFIFLLFSLLIIACSGTSNRSQSTEVIVEVVDSIEMIRSKIFRAGMIGYDLYVVVTVKNLNTGEVKDISTYSHSLRSAINIEKGQRVGTQMNNADFSNRYFAFSNDSALWTIGFDIYTEIDFERFKEGQIDKLEETLRGIRADEWRGINFNDIYDNEAMLKAQRMFAHFMFNNGIVVQSCSQIGSMLWCFVFREAEGFPSKPGEFFIGEID